MPTKPEKPSQKPLNSYAKYSSLGIQMAAIIGGGSYAGYKLDEYYKNEIAIFTIILSLTSIGFAMYVVIRDIIKSSK